ncbi:MAG: glutamine amidotransferase-related protein [Acutalibacteraceae bacterium]
MDIKQNDGLFQNIAPEPYVYFVHSYYLKAQDREIVSATTTYGIELDVAIHKDNVHAVQFHPEKSGVEALKCWKILHHLSNKRRYPAMHAKELFRVWM